MWLYPSWQQDRIGTDVIFSGRWAQGGQYWRMWEFPYVWFTEFPNMLCRSAGGKPRGKPIWVADADWGNPDMEMPAWRLRNYHSPEEDYTGAGNPTHTQDYDAGYARAWEDAYALGYTEGIEEEAEKGKGKSKGKGKGKGKGNRQYRQKNRRKGKGKGKGGNLDA